MQFEKHILRRMKFFLQPMSYLLSYLLNFNTFFILHYNYWGKLFEKNSLILYKVRNVELQPFPSLYSHFLPFFICQPFIDSLPSPSLTTLPHTVFLPSPSISLPFPYHFPSVVTYIPLFPLNLPHSLSIFPFPFQSFLSLLPFPVTLRLLFSSPFPFFFPLPFPPFSSLFSFPFSLSFSFPFSLSFSFLFSLPFSFSFPFPYSFPSPPLGSLIPPPLLTTTQMVWDEFYTVYTPVVYKLIFLFMIRKLLTPE